MTHTFRVHVGVDASDMFVELDGERLDGVCGVSFSARGGELTVVSLRILGEVVVDGNYSPREIAHIRRDMIHPGSLTARLRRAFRELFPGTEETLIRGLATKVVKDVDPFTMDGEV